MEQMIAGRTPPNAERRFSGPEIAEMAGRYPAADRPDAGARRAPNSTRTHCQGCHRPPIDERGNSTISTTRTGGRTNENGEPILVLENYPDRAYRHRSGAGRKTCATGRSRPRPISELTTPPSRFALGEVVEKTVDYIYDIRRTRTETTTAADRGRAAAMNGYMPERDPGRARLQGASAQRCLGDAALSPQRFGADHLRAAVAGQGPAAEILSRQPRIRSRSISATRPTTSRTVSSSTPRSAATRTAGTSSRNTTRTSR